MFPIHTNEEGHVFRVPRDCLENQVYFKAMLTNEPPFLYLPFPAFVVTHIVGRLQHADNWPIPDDPHVLLGLKFCQMVEEESLPAVPVLPRMMPQTPIEELIERLRFQGEPLVATTGTKASQKFDHSYPYLLVGFFRPIRTAIKFFRVEDGWMGTETEMFSATKDTYGLIFDMYENFMVLKPKYLQLFNSGTIVVKCTDVWASHDIITVQDKVSAA